MNKTVIKNRSVSHLSLLSVLISIILFLIVFCITFFGSVYSMRKQIVRTDRMILSMHIAGTDRTLDDIYDSLITFAATDSEFGYYNNYTSANDINMSISRLKTNLSNHASVNSLIATLFAFSFKDDMYLPVPSGSKAFSINESALKKYFFENIKTNPDQFRKKWNIVTVKEEQYLVRILVVQDMCIGAWISAKDLLQVPKESNFKSSVTTFLYIDDQYHALSNEAAEEIAEKKISLNGDYSDFYFTGQPSTYFVVGVPSESANIRLVAITPNTAVLNTFPFNHILFILIGSCILISLIMHTIVNRKLMIRPLNRLAETLSGIEENGLRPEYPEENLREYQMVYHVLDNMLNEIENLKMEVYEERLQSQAEKYALLELQMKPHFILNSLNSIYRMSQLGKTDALQQMTLQLIKHYRYVLASDVERVPLAEEIEHVKNYTKIQSIRWSEKIVLETEIPEFLSGVPILPLLIYEPVENALKYARLPGNPLRIHISVTYTQIGAEDGLHIRIRDNGPGMSEDVLAVVRSRNIVIKKDGSRHIGLYNSFNRLNHHYGNMAKMEIDNVTSPDGVEVNIIFPYKL